MALFIVAEQNLIVRSETDISDSRARMHISETLDEAYKHMKQKGLEKYVPALKQFAHHENEEVRLWFATILLPYDEPEARNILEKLKESESIVSSYAEITLDNWGSGKLQL